MKLLLAVLGGFLCVPGFGQLFYRITPPGGKPSHLIGTMHLVPEDRMVFAPAVTAALGAGYRLIENRAVHRILIDDLLVAIPVAHALTHRIAAVEELHEPHALLDEPAGQNAVAGKPALERIGHVIGAIEGECLG